MHGNIAACFSVNMHGLQEKSLALLIGKYSHFGSECHLHICTIPLGIYEKSDTEPMFVLYTQSLANTIVSDLKEQKRTSLSMLQSMRAGRETNSPGRAKASVPGHRYYTTTSYF
jgi:hypothetical protein